MVTENYKQDFTGLYLELCVAVAAKIPEVLWQDLWHNQVNFLEEEHPFPTPAWFYAIRILNTEDASENAQDCDVQVDIYHFFETFNDTYSGSYNQEDALDFLRNCNKAHQLFHGTTGATYSEMRRVAFTPVDTGSAGNLYRQSFVCKLRDLSAMKEYVEVTPNEITIVREDPVFTPPAGGGFVLPG
ncbi:MAG: hypothetical protein JJE55_06940 [Flavobacteriaceae bacterium]|nr:hypothetical protein [Flavobacteriaceae bacterium]